MTPVSSAAGDGAGTATKGSGQARPDHSRTAALRLDHFDAVCLDLDAVLTDAARVHQDAWATTLSEMPGEAAPFATEDATLARAEGPQVLAGAVRLMRLLRAAGIGVAVVSASRYCAGVLASSGLKELVEVVVDGQVAAAMGLGVKPGPAAYLEATRRLGADPGRVAIITCAGEGVAAGRRGGFGLVAGVGQGRQAVAHASAGADLALPELSALELAGPGPLADGWHLTYRPQSDTGSGMRETLCTLANGYFGTRGAATWDRDDGAHYPGTYLAGVYDRLRTDVDGHQVEHESIVNAPNWLPLSFSAEGGPFLGEPGAVVSGEELRLDLRGGVLRRRYRVTDPAGRQTSVTERRLVSMADPHLAAIEADLVAENWAGELRIRSGIDGTCCADQTAESRLLAHCHLRLTGSGDGPAGVVWLAARTTQSGVLIATAARSRADGAAGPAELRRGARGVSHEHVVQMARGARCRVEKVTALYTSRDWAISEPTAAARQAAAGAPGFGELLAAHRAAWERLWSQARIEIGTADRPAGVVNLHMFHLLQVASPHVTGIDAGLAARGLHGEGYEGHVFWDELFVFPVLNLRFPAVSRELLGYRQRRLAAAKHLARTAGEAGARFPWQSGSDGRDETPVMLFNPRSGRWMADRSRQQRHVGLAVAWNCWQYWQATGDDAFLTGGGGEVFFEVARHFAGLASFDEDLGRFRIRAVMGPDEFHDGYPWAEVPGIDDNAYTNVLTAWVLARAVELARRLSCDRREDVPGRLVLGDADIARFDAVSRKLYVPFHDGVISQFAGYERLEPIDLGAYRARYRNIGRLDLILEAEGDTVRHYQVAKQADTLMLFYLFSPAELRDVFARLGYELTEECARRTISYYTARVTHGSTLSQVVHAWVAARFDRAASWRHLTAALAADMADTQGGTTREGIHLGAMAGTIDLLQRCYTGLETRDGVLIADPVLPGELSGLRLTLAYRGHRLDVQIGPGEIAINSATCEAAPIKLLLAGRPMTLLPGETARVRLFHASPGADPRPRAGGHGMPGRPTTAIGPHTGAGPPARHPSRLPAGNATSVTDPVCGMVIEAPAAAGSSTHKGTAYFFCSKACQERFNDDPQRYAPGDQRAKSAPTDLRADVGASKKRADRPTG